MRGAEQAVELGRGRHARPGGQSGYNVLMSAELAFFHFYAHLALCFVASAVVAYLSD